jgi:tartrate-resistant acid phosphatase type 5
MFYYTTKMRRKCCLKWSLILCLLGASLASTLVAADSLHFLAVGDTGTGAEGQKQVAEALAKYADAVKGSSNAINFILMLGDNFYSDGVKTVDDPQWQDKFEKMYDAKRLPMPFYVVLGNHDWRNDAPDAEIEYPKLHPNSRWKMDGHYYKRSFPSKSADANAAPLADFFFIDTEAWNTKGSHVSMYPDKKLGDKQMAWLEKELKASHARWKIVVAHHPLYSDGEHGHDVQVLALRKRLDPLFKENGVNAFITGHDHDLQRIEIPDHPVLFLISGAGSKVRTKKYDDWKPFHGAQLGFLSVELDQKEMRGKFLDVDNKPIDIWHRKASSSLQATARK